MIRIGSLLVIFSLFVNDALEAWWDLGHAAVAEIAYRQLHIDVREMVDRLIEAVSGPFPRHRDFVTASLWADDIVHDGLEYFSPWHVSYYPYDPENILTPQEQETIVVGVKGRDMVWAMSKCVRALRNRKSTLWVKGFALRLLLHMIGDIHQPAHCATYYSRRFPRGDCGGNLFKIQHDRYKTLHNLLDGAFGLCSRRLKRPLSGEDRRRLDSLVAALEKKFPRESFYELEEDTSFERWREESYEIAVSFIYAFVLPDEIPSREFMQKGRKMAARRLALAGYRLADLLNALLPSEEDS